MRWTLLLMAISPFALSTTSIGQPPEPATQWVNSLLAEMDAARDVRAHTRYLGKRVKIAGIVESIAGSEVTVAGARTLAEAPFGDAQAVAGLKPGGVFAAECSVVAGRMGPKLQQCKALDKVPSSFPSGQLPVGSMPPTPKPVADGPASDAGVVLAQSLKRLQGTWLRDATSGNALEVWTIDGSQITRRDKRGLPRDRGLQLTSPCSARLMQTDRASERVYVAVDGDNAYIGSGPVAVTSTDGKHVFICHRKYVYVLDRATDSCTRYKPNHFRWKDNDRHWLPPAAAECGQDKDGVFVAQRRKPLRLDHRVGAISVELDDKDDLARRVTQDEAAKPLAKAVAVKDGTRANKKAAFDDWSLPKDNVGSVEPGTHVWMAAQHYRWSSWYLERVRYINKDDSGRHYGRGHDQMRAPSAFLLTSPKPDALRPAQPVLLHAPSMIMNEAVWARYVGPSKTPGNVVVEALVEEYPMALDVALATIYAPPKDGIGTLMTYPQEGETRLGWLLTRQNEKVGLVDVKTDKLRWVAPAEATPFDSRPLTPLQRVRSISGPSTGQTGRVMAVLGQGAAYLVWPDDEREFGTVSAMIFEGFDTLVPIGEK